MRTIRGALSAQSPIHIAQRPATRFMCLLARVPAARLLPAFAALIVLPLAANLLAAPEATAISSDSRWREDVTWEGRLSTPEADCQSDGLLLAPWGVYPSGSKGVVVWCVAPDIYAKLGPLPWELWSPVRPQGAEGYCHSWHNVGLVHEEPDGRFWCEETPGAPEATPGPNRGNV